MAESPAVRAGAEVRLWGDTVGAVLELESGRVLFEYADEFRGRGLEISPIHLPTDLAGPRSFEELRRRPAFEGLPGVLADALPDTFGRRVIRAFYEARGQGKRALSPVQRLLYTGERAIGALTFHPATELPRPAEAESLEVQALAHDARRIVRGEPGVAVPEIYRIGSSAGGQRPKALVHWDPESATLRSGALEPEPGETPCILKFDGVASDDSQGELASPAPYNRVEAAYHDMAVAAGVEMAPIDVLEVDSYTHLLIRRFDLVDGHRLHQHTFGGLVHVDYNEPGASCYEEYFRTILRLGLAYDALRQAFHRLAFNVLAVNQDDHVKNLSFHMDPTGAWSLTPAYDVTFARGEGWTAAHQMRVADKTTDIRDADLLTIAKEFGVKRAEKVLERTREALAGWEPHAARYGVPEPVMGSIRSTLEERDRSLRS